MRAANMKRKKEERPAESSLVIAFQASPGKFVFPLALVPRLSCYPEVSAFRFVAAVAVGAGFRCFMRQPPAFEAFVRWVSADLGWGSVIGE